MFDVGPPPIIDEKDPKPLVNFKVQKSADIFREEDRM
jgi:hypothetical protein